jgi:3-hydroxymyristoyl/3-hydroxydecanoyl-(acyl carrier protein) dehydratase
MRFLFVDKIKEYNDSKIVGSKHFSADSALRYRNQQIAPGVISEAIGQLASWLAISRLNFASRPVFLFADRIQAHAPLAAGSNVELKAEITEMDEQTLVFRGEAFADGILVHTIHTSSGYFMPLQDLEDPLITRQRFAQLCGSGLDLDGQSGSFNFGSLVDRVVSNDERSIVCVKTMSKDEPFYADHFPRFPVTPIVMINEMIGEATRRLVSQIFGEAELQIAEVSDVKIKNFLKPGETAEIKVQLIESMKVDGREGIQTVAELFKEGKRVLRGRYHYFMEKSL